MARRPPDTASIARAIQGAKLCAPSAQRNIRPLCDLLAQVAPANGSALELASGTGQHVVEFAACLPGLRWQPTEPEPERRASIEAYRAEAGLDNILPAIDLDASVPNWSTQHSGQSLIVVINLLHLISTSESQVLITEAARALTQGGRLVIYGPFMRSGDLISDGDIAFHASLTAQDPEIGYKDDFDVLDMAISAGLTPAEVVEMPANNLALVLEKSGN